METKQKTGVIALTITIITGGVIYWYWDVLIPSRIVPVSAPPAEVQDDMSLKQFQELDALWNERMKQVVSDPQSQLKELESLYKKLGVSPPSEAEAAKQLEELEKTSQF